MIKVDLPVEQTYSNFVYQTHPNWVRYECTYKLSFEDGSFYIGKTYNLAGRIYNHCRMMDLKEGSTPTRKHIKMYEAIQNAESVCFGVLAPAEQEKEVIKQNISNKLCLNMKIA